MADYVDTLSDAELRTKLAEYGFPVVPITTTTRKVMTKKLKMLIENKNKINSEGRRSLAKYSSEEESDEETKKKDKRRMTVAGGMLPPSAANKNTRKSTRKIETHVQESYTTTKRSSRLVKPVPEQDLETGSDSEPEIVDEYLENKELNHEPEIKSSYLTQPDTSYSITDTSARFISPRSPLGLSAPRISPSMTLNTSYGSPQISSRYTSGALDTGASGDSVDRLNQIRSRLSLSSYDTRKVNEDIVPTSEAPFLSNFSKRLSQLSSSTAPKIDASYRNDIIKEHDANGSSYNRSYLSRVRNRDYPQDFKSRQEKNIFKNNFVSFALIGIVVVFFATLGVMYMGIRDNSSLAEKSEYEIPICEEQEIGAKPGVNCVLRDAVTDALNLMKVLAPELAKRAVIHHCTDSNTQAWMNDDHIIEFVSRNYALKDPYEIQKAVNNLQVLVLRNPKMGINVFRIPTDTQSTALESMDDILSLRPSRNLGFVTANPELPLKCIVLNRLYTVFCSLLIISLGFVSIFLGQRLYKYVLLQKKIKNDKIYSLVERIIDILQTNAAENQENFLAVNHVRDVLIPPQERKAMASIWSAAVKFLEENESRVRTEVQIVSGEEFHVWRWVGANLNTSGSPRSKSWQGQAFETNSGSVNSLPCSPTPCLKIRGMFDERELNLSTVRDAVLSKIASKCRVLHCEPDRTSRCVYIKCASQPDAATAYQNLHGWWFDGHLVTVKYLRLERYMQRFPDSPVRGPPFLISSTSPLETDWIPQDE